MAISERNFHSNVVIDFSGKFNTNINDNFKMICIMNVQFSSSMEFIRLI